MAPTKADPLSDRMLHAFGERRIVELFQILVRKHGLVNLLTDEAQCDLLSLCIKNHNINRRFAAESRKHYREMKRIASCLPPGTAAQRGAYGQPDA
jgi:hypothetical protein